MAHGQFFWRAQSNARRRSSSAEDAAPLRYEKTQTNANVLEHNLRTQLPDARVARAGNHAEVAAGEVSVRVVEIRVVREIKELCADLNRNALRDSRVFHQRTIPIDDARALEEPPIA